MFTSAKQLDGSGYLEIFLPFFLLLMQYEFASIRVGFVGLFLVAAIILYKNKYVVIHREYKIVFAFLLFVLFVDVVDMLISLDLGWSQLNRMVEYTMFFFLTFIVTQDGIDEDKLYNTWKIATIIYSLGLLYHIVLIYKWGSGVNPITLIPNYSLRENAGFAVSRPLSFFAEPESFVNAVIPFLILSLRQNKTNWAIFTTIMLLLSTSTIGVVFCIIVWAYFFTFTHFYSNRQKIRLIILFIVIVLAFFNFDIFGLSANKTISVLNGESTMSTRVWNGLVIVSKLEPYEYLFGSTTNDINMYIANNISDFINSESVLMYWKIDRLFLNTFSQLVFYYGIIGLFLFMYSFLNIIKPNSSFMPLLVVFIIGTFAQTSLLNAYYFQTLILVLSFAIRDKSKKI